MFDVCSFLSAQGKVQVLAANLWPDKKFCSDMKHKKNKHRKGT